MKKILTIGGSDTWGGGGVQTDLRTFDQFNVFGLMALSSIAVADEQNSFVVKNIDDCLFNEQLQTIAASFSVSAIKIGLLNSLENISIVNAFLKQQECIIVVDPVLAFKETEQQLVADYVVAIKKLCKQADLITPNLTELSLLVNNFRLETNEEIKNGLISLYEEIQTPILVKIGGRLNDNQAVDILYDGEKFTQFELPKINSLNINGAGCSYSSAITACLSKGFSLEDAVNQSKEFVYQSIKMGFAIDSQNGNVWYQGDNFNEK